MNPAELEYFCLEEIPINSFLIIRVDVPGPMEKYNAAKDLLPILNPYTSIFRQKNITVIIMTPKEDLNILTEEEMNKAGWYRKEQ